MLLSNQKVESVKVIIGNDCGLLRVTSNKENLPFAALPRGKFLAHTCNKGIYVLTYLHNFRVFFTTEKLLDPLHEMPAIRHVLPHQCNLLLPHCHLLLIRFLLEGRSFFLSA